MIKVVLAMILAISLFAGCGLIRFPIDTSCNVRWEGSITEEFAITARQQLETALENCKVLRVDMTSPGGSVVAVLNTVHEMQMVQAKGLIIEIHGGAFIASGATLLLAAGTRGHRFVRDNSVALVHGMQQRSFDAPQCVEYDENASDDSGKIINIMTVVLAREYARLSGKPVSETLAWLHCDNTQVGVGKMMVDLGLADIVEP